MAITVNHQFVSAKGDGTDATVVRPSNWNASHNINLATNKIIGRLTAGNGLAEELAVTPYMIGLLNTADLAALSIVLGLPTAGDAKLSFKPTADPGWVLANDGSIGDSLSGGTTRANADTLALFTMFYNNFSDVVVPVQLSTGGATTRVLQGTAALAFSTHCRIVLPKALGRALIVGGAGAGLTNRVLGTNGGEEAHVLTIAELASHTHTQQGTFGGSGAGSGSISGSGSGSCSGVTGAADRGLDHLHTLGGTTGFMNQSNPHGHGVSGGTQGGTSSFARPQTVVADSFIPIGSTAISINQADINHTHNLPGTTGAADRSIDHLHGFSGSASVSVSGSCSVTSVSVNTTISGQTVATGSGSAANVMQPWTAWNVMIKL